jgi:type IV pilus assembly protein PilM
MKMDIGHWLRRSGRAVTAMPIGIEFASEALNMVQCEQGAGGIRIRAAATLPYGCNRDALLADRKRLRGLVDDALRSAPFEGRRVHTSLPANEVRIIPLTVSVSAAQGEAAAVIRALKEKLRSDLSGDVVDYLQVRSVAGGGAETSVLAAVAPRTAVLAHLHTFEHAGLEPMSVDVGPAALTRLLSSLQSDQQDGSVLLINFGIEKTYITVVWGRRLMLDREVQFGQSILISTLAGALDVDDGIARALLQSDGSPQPAAPAIGNDAERIIDEVLHPQFSILAEEVSRTLVYIASKTHGSATSSIYLNGSLALYPYVQRRVQRLFDVPVTLLDPLKGLPAAGPQAYHPRLQPNAGIALATGLALRG